LLCGKLFSRDFGRQPVEVFSPGGEVVKLADQAGSVVERDVDVGVVFQDGRHVQVVFCGVNTHPGPEVSAGLRIFVVDRLVLVPDDGDVQHIVSSLPCRAGRRR